MKKEEKEKEEKLRKKGKKKKEEPASIVKKAVGVFLITIGIAGLVLPIIPGIVLILIGLAFYHNRGIKEYAEEKAHEVKKILRKYKILKPKKKAKVLKPEDKNKNLKIQP